MNKLLIILAVMSFCSLNILHSVEPSLSSTNNQTDLTADAPRIFDKPDLSWFKEDMRAEKILISTGAVSVTIGSAMLLSGLLLYFLKPTAQSTTNDYAFLSITGVGGGLMLTGSVLITVGSIRLGIYNAANKETTYLGLSLTFCLM